MSDDRKQIETHGDLSPGYVGGDFKVNQTIVNQHADIMRRQWRGLDEIDYPALADNEERRAKYTYQLALHLRRAFKDCGYVSFSSLVSLRETKIDAQDDPIALYCLVTHQVPFSGALRHTWKYLWNPRGDKRAQQAYQDELNEEITQLIGTWSFDIRLALVDRLLATQFTYDPDARRITIGPPPVSSTTPADYPEKVRTTSELLAFLSCVTGSPFMNLGDIACITSHYPLFKLALELLDHRSWELDRVRVNTLDCEEWDYINTAADAEVGRYAAERKDSA